MAGRELSLHQLILSAKATAGLLTDDERESFVQWIGDGLAVPLPYADAAAWSRRFGGPWRIPTYREHPPWYDRGEGAGPVARADGTPAPSATLGQERPDQRSASPPPTATDPLGERRGQLYLAPPEPERDRQPRLRRG